MPKTFNFENEPFDRLTREERFRFADSLDIVFLKAGTTVIGPNTQPDRLFIIIKGFVEERDESEVITLRGPDDSFDSHSLVHGPHGSAFVVAEEVLCYTVPRAVILDLIHANPAFGAFFYREISRRLDMLAVHSEQRQLNALMTGRVGDAYLHPQVIIDGNRSIEDAAHVMQDCGTDAVLVRAPDVPQPVGAAVAELPAGLHNGDGEEERVGIVTGMNLAKAVILHRLPLDTPVAEISHFDLVTVRRDDFMFSALLLMTRHNKRRLVIQEGDQFVGILDEIDVLGFLSNNSHVVADRIDRATSLTDLASAVEEIDRTVEAMTRQGVKVHVVNDVASELNRRLFARVFAMVVPYDLTDIASLIVMGSEGRREQALRTDQDNGLILAREIEPEVLEDVRRRFTQAMLDLGYPSCPGEVMVRNPMWSRTIEGFEEQFRRWLWQPDNHTPMNVAIFYDAESVAGHPALLRRAKRALFDLLAEDNAFHAHFARAIDSFDVPIGMFHNLVVEKGERRDSLDLKKGGIFPVVHGVRSLALENRLEETGTLRRITRLADLGVFDAAFAHELAEAFQFLLTLQLRIRRIGLRYGGAAETLVRPSDLTTLERDLLRDALSVVKRLRELVRHHFRLSVF